MRSGSSSWKTFAHSPDGSIWARAGGLSRHVHRSDRKKAPTIVVARAPDTGNSSPRAEKTQRITPSSAFRKKLESHLDKDLSLSSTPETERILVNCAGRIKKFKKNDTVSLTTSELEIFVGRKTLGEHR